jgi:ubiquitin C-terminal hydrolase
MNLGNTCYINSVISIISSIYELCEWIEDIKSYTTVEGQLIHEINEIIQLSKKKNVIISPGKFIKFNKSLFNLKQKKDFIMNTQCDSTEYLLFIMECICVYDNNIIPSLCESTNTQIYTSMDGLYIEETTSSDWIRYICVPNKKEVTLEECLYFTYKDETIQKLNEKINIQQSYTKHTTITKNPNILILQYNKCDTLVIAPNILDISPFSKYPNKYELFSIINYIGNHTSGHYYTFIKENDDWYSYDDANKQKVTNIEYKDNYCLFYRKIK